ncbi:hypothetical protein FXO37_24368 [Capsicum annuum]|nr:hypothetical protein FXO37_24368 [Capsicum annuum]
MRFGRHLLEPDIQDYVGTIFLCPVRKPPLNPNSCTIYNGLGELTMEAHCATPVDLDASAMLNMNLLVAVVELAVPCEKPGLRVFEGFTVGFHPRSWEIVYNGMTQLGYEEAHKEFSFNTAQTRVALYMTAIASVSGSVQKPLVKVSPEQGLKVRFSGSAATGGSPTTLSPTVLLIDWRCNVARDNPYDVEVTIPIENYDPIQFTLTKMCEYQQGEGGDASRGWAIFGVLSCILLVASTLFCCGGFIYKTQVQNQRGLDALPGITLLSACLETVSLPTYLGVLTSWDGVEGFE